MEDLKQRSRQAVHNQAQPTVTVLSSLLAVADELGYIPAEAVAEVAAANAATVNDVWAVVSFYPNFRTAPPCERRIEVCWGPSCHLTGAMPVIAAVLQAAGLSAEGDTPDGRLTVRYNTCLGACAQAPVMSVDHHLIGRLSPQQAAQQVSRALAGSGSAAANPVRPA